MHFTFIHFNLFTLHVTIYWQNTCLICKIPVGLSLLATIIPSLLNHARGVYGILKAHMGLEF